MNDLTSDGDGARTFARGREAGGVDDSRAAGGDSLSAAGGEPAVNADDDSVVKVEADPSSRRREDAGPAGSVDFEASHGRWMLAAAACAVVAAVLLFAVGVNAAFVAAVLGVLAWFWDQRNRIRAGIVTEDDSEEGRDELEEFEDEGGRDEGGRRSDEV